MKAAAGTVFCLSIFFASPAFASAGNIISVAGEVFMTRDGQIPVIVTRDTKIGGGDVVFIANDGLLQFRLANDAEVRLQNNSHIRIDENSIALTRGGLRVNTRWMIFDDRAKFKIRTPVAVIGFRGTETVVNHSEGKQTTTVFTVIGSNEIASVGDFPHLITRPNDTAQVVRGQAPTIVPSSYNISPSIPVPK